MARGPSQVRLVAGSLIVCLIGAVIGFAVGSHTLAKARMSASDIAARYLAAVDAPGWADDAIARGNLEGVGTALDRVLASASDVRAVALAQYNLDRDQTVVLEGKPSTVLLDQNRFHTAALAFYRGHQKLADGPTDSGSGPSLTAFAAVRGKDANHLVIIGLVLDASGVIRAALFEGFSTTAIVCLLLGLPWAAKLYFAGNSGRDDTIRRLLLAVEQSRSGILIYSPSGEIQYANRGICAMSGFSHEEISGKNWRDFKTDRTPESVFANIVASIHAGRTWQGEWVNQRKNGEYYHVRSSISPVYSDVGALSHIIAVVDDISDLKRVQTELTAARERAEAGDRAKGQFLAMMSHEIRTPLNGIIGFANLLLETSLSSEQKDFLTTIRTSGESLLELTDRVLDFSRLHADRLQFNPQATNPRDCIEEALDLLSARAAEKKLELLHWIDSDVPEEVLVDPVRLRQVIVNLVGNATKFTTAGEIEVTVALDDPAKKPTVGDNCVMRISVRDTGIGIAPVDHDKLFSPFSQVDNSLTRRYGGTGLGLAISKDLIRLMGGDIIVKSQKGSGSVFEFTIKVPVLKLSVGNRPGLAGRTLGIYSLHPGMRGELENLARRWNCRVVHLSITSLEAEEWDAALFDLGDDGAGLIAQVLASYPTLKKKNCVGLVPVGAPQRFREEARQIFRTLVSKPTHHEALYSTILESLGTAVEKEAPERARSSVIGAGLKVLVVEDNLVNQRLAQKMLSSLGCEVALADNGVQGLERISCEDFHAVFTDVHMPDMDGITMIADVRAGRAGPSKISIPIVVLTADSQAAQYEKAISAGATEYITKPLTTAKIEGAVRRVAAANRSS